MTQSTAGSGTPRNRGINYLGNLGRVLRDLTGFATLTFELLQNADDAGASSLLIDVGQDALVVFNDATFSDCGDQDLVSENCLYLAERGHRCDFHSFRDVASGDKRGRVDTAGAFGIGFIAVYQVADRAVLISSGRRWDVDEMRPEASRIMEYPAPNEAGTTFVLPWARDPNSAFRRATASAAIVPDDQDQLFDVLISTLPTAMLFLRNVRDVELRRDGQSACRYRREDADDICEITGGDQARQWLMLRGDFAGDAAELRREFPGKIEDRRRADVSVAIPLDAEVDGLLCAYLPTDERSGLPAHVNADFSPESDRKHLITDSVHGRWNRLAVRAAARIIAQRLPYLPSVVGHEQLWQLIFAAYDARPAGPDTGIAAYWQEIAPLLPDAPVMWTTTGEWTTPSATVFLYSSDEDESIPVLEQLGVLVMHPQVGAFVRRMSGRAGARQLSIEILATALQDTGLTSPTSLADAPLAVAAKNSREILWRELERLLNRQTSTTDHELLRRTAVMPGTDGRLWPANQLQRADPLTAHLLTDLGLSVAFLDRSALPDGCDRLATFCPSLDLPFALTLLASSDGAGALRDALESRRVTAAQILSWLRGYEQAILASPALRSGVRALPIYPTGTGFRPLDEVMLPGGFTDRLGIAEAIDREQVSEHVAFIQRLGATTLTLRTYLTESLPSAARRPGMLADPRWQQLIVELAAQLDEFAQDAQVRNALAPLPLVACGTTFLPASSCHFASETVTAVLGAETPVARPLDGHERSTTSLYEWLGVPKDPQLPDVVTRARQLAAGDQDPESRHAVAAIIGYLARFVPDRRTQVPDTLGPLRDLAWLPVRGDRIWHRPTEVNTVFSETLFATQGQFLNMPLKVQQDAADLLHWLGVESNPTVAQVVAHLLTLAAQGAPVTRGVYIELNRSAADPEINRLVGKACLLMPDGRYVKPAAVFRQDNPFGRFRQFLGPDFDAIGALLNRLGVKRVPDHEDARSVLIDIARQEHTRFHLPVEEDDDLAVIWRCWQMLDGALARDDVDAAWFAPLRELPVIPDAASVLTMPTRLLIDDMPGVAAALNIGDAVIRRKEGMWRAFQAAGVRSLTDAVDVDILKIEETTRDGDVRNRIATRLPALARVLDVDPNGLPRLTATVTRLAFPQTPILHVRYRLAVFGLASDEVSLKALYVPAERADRDEDQLISCPQHDGTWPWMLIAKELARALYPGELPGPLASSLYVALSAQSLDAADNALDDAGWPRLDHVEVAVPGSGPGLSFGADDIAADWPGRSQPAHAVDDTSGGSPPDGAATGRTRTLGAQSSDDDGDRTARDSRDGRSGSYLSSDDRASGDSVELEGPAPGDDALSDSRRQQPPDSGSPPANRGRLRSYVMLGDGEECEQTRVDHSAVDQAGVRQVAEFERAAGRHPEVMPHENPGFDVISRDDAGHIVRHIEVKSTAGGWDDMGVGLTRPQFEFSQLHRDTFWLYVVEHALDDNRARVIRIANPSGRADEFRFDGGWSAVSENADVTEAPPGISSSAALAASGADTLREARIVIPLTQGNLNHGHIYLRKHLDFFPADTIGPANEQDGNGTLVTLHFDGFPGAIQTDIAGDHKSFRRRGAWTKFFAHHHLAEGDSVAIERLSPYEYRIAPAR
jgi:hypothetical protein